MTRGRALRRPGLAVALLAAGTAAASERLHSWPEADLALGRKLIADNGCVACHVKKVGGDGSAIYRPMGRVNSPAALRGMVEMCNTELGLALFPDEVTSVAEALQRDHYRFTVAGPAAGPAGR